MTFHFLFPSHPHPTRPTPSSGTGPVEKFSIKQSIFILPQWDSTRSSNKCLSGGWALSKPLWALRESPSFKGTAEILKPLDVYCKGYSLLSGSSPPPKKPLYRASEEERVLPLCTGLLENTSSGDK